MKNIAGTKAPDAAPGVGPGGIFYGELYGNAADPQARATGDQKPGSEVRRCSALSVRFRYDAKLQQRLKTDELIVERAECTAPQPHYNAETLVFLHIKADDMAARLQAKAAGGRWNPEKQLWFVKYGKIAGTPLEKHIQVDTK